MNTVLDMAYSVTLIRPTDAAGTASRRRADPLAAPPAQTPQRLADETGHQAGTLRRVLRLPDLLQEFAPDRVLADRLVFARGRQRDTHGDVELGLLDGPITQPRSSSQAC